MNVVFLGPPGAGKGTYAQYLVEKWHIPHISTGDILRDAIRNKTEMGKKAEPFVVSGRLVPDDVMVGILEERLSQPDTEKGFILDGFPRTIPQADMLEKLLKKQGRKLDYIINITISDDVIVFRLANRRVCPKCGAVYNMVGFPPKNDEICDICGTKLIQRKDDREETVRKRLAVYREKTAPLIEYYSNYPGYRVFNDYNGPIEERVEKLMEML